MCSLVEIFVFRMATGITPIMILRMFLGIQHSVQCLAMIPTFVATVRSSAKMAQLLEKIAFFLAETMSGDRSRDAPQSINATLFIW